MSGDNLARWLRLGEVLDEDQLRLMVEVAEQLVDPLACGSMDLDHVRQTFQKQLTDGRLVSKSYEHEGDASRDGKTE